MRCSCAKNITTIVVVELNKVQHHDFLNMMLCFVRLLIHYVVCPSFWSTTHLVTVLPHVGYIFPTVWGSLWDSVGILDWEIWDSLGQFSDSCLTVLWRLSDGTLKVFWWLSVSFLICQFSDSLLQVFNQLSGSFLIVFWQFSDSFPTVFWYSLQFPDMFNIVLTAF